MTNQVITILKSLSDETRLRMVLELLDRDEVTCQELSKKFGLSQPTLSHHYNKLIAAGVVSSRKEGVGWFYRLNHEALASAGIDLHQLKNRLVTS